MTRQSGFGTTYDGLNRDTAIAAISGGFDARGNLTKDGVRTFTYDIENRLLTKVSTEGQPNLTLTYDPEGRLASYTVVKKGSESLLGPLAEAAARPHVQCHSLSPQRRAKTTPPKIHQ